MDRTLIDVHWNYQSHRQTLRQANMVIYTSIYIQIPPPPPFQKKINLQVFNNKYKDSENMKLYCNNKTKTFQITPPYTDVIFLLF